MKHVVFFAVALIGHDARVWIAPKCGLALTRRLIQWVLMGMTMCASAQAQMSSGCLHDLIDLEHMERGGERLQLNNGDGVALTMNQALGDQKQTLATFAGLVSGVDSLLSDPQAQLIWAKRNWVAGAAARIVLGARISKWQEWLLDSTPVRRGLYLSGNMFYLRDAAAADEVDYHQDLSLPVHRRDEVAVVMRLFGQESIALATQPAMLTAIADERLLAGADVVPEPSTASLTAAPLFLALLRRRRGGV